MRFLLSSSRDISFHLILIQYQTCSRVTKWQMTLSIHKEIELHCLLWETKQMITTPKYWGQVWELHVCICNKSFLWKDNCSTTSEKKEEKKNTKKHPTLRAIIWKLLKLTWAQLVLCYRAHISESCITGGNNVILGINHFNFTCAW